MEKNKENSDIIKNITEIPTNEAADKAYKYLFDLSVLQNNLLWTRTNILLIIQGSTLTLVASSFLGENSFGKIILCLFGLITSIFFLRITKGGSFWITYFETKMKEIEKFVLGEQINIFRENPHYNMQNKSVKYKGYVSTRKSLLFISTAFIMIWLILIIYFSLSYLEIIEYLYFKV